MATTIDALVVTLGLDPSQFTQGQREALEAFKRTQEAAVSGGKEIEAHGKKTAEFFSMLKREALGLLSVFFAGKGIKEFIGHITDLDASTSRMAKVFNVSQGDLLAWRNVIKQVGGDAAEADAAISGLSDAMQDFLLNPGSANPQMFGVLARLGVAEKDYTNPVKILEALSRLSQEPDFKNDPARFRAEAKLLGVSQPGVVNALIEGGPKLQERLAAAKKAVGVPNSEDAKEFQTSMALMEDSALSLGRVLTKDVVAPLTQLLDKLKEIVQFVRDHGTDELLPDWVKDSLKWLEKNWEPKPGSMLDTINSQKDAPVVPIPRWLIETTMGPKTAAEMFGPAARGGSKTAYGEGGGWGKGPGIESLILPDVVGAGASARSVHNRWHHQSSSTVSTVRIGSVNLHMPNARDGADAARTFADELKTLSGLSADGGPR